MFSATTHAAEAIAHEMKNAVHGNRVLGGAEMPRPIIPMAKSVNARLLPSSHRIPNRIFAESQDASWKTFNVEFMCACL
jgi:hypothetical protein